MRVLEKASRGRLESAVIQARRVAEDAARTELERLGVGEPEAPRYLSADQREQRLRLRAHGRQLGEPRDPDGRQGLDRLAGEAAYEQWHRMLFARFLAENELLIHPQYKVAVSLEECRELAEQAGAESSTWEVAAGFAARMLPQIFRLDSPCLALSLAPEERKALETILAGLPGEVFQADDALGWVYQFWQTRRKDEVNASEVKIGAEELPAVTQLFTEPYMVHFLLDNSLGAWWAARRLSPEDLAAAPDEATLRQRAALPGLPLDYLRFVRTGRVRGARRRGPSQAGPNR